MSLGFPLSPAALITQPSKTGRRRGRQGIQGGCWKHTDHLCWGLVLINAGLRDVETAGLHQKGKSLKKLLGRCAPKCEPGVGPLTKNLSPICLPEMFHNFQVSNSLRVKTGAILQLLYESIGEGIFSKLKLTSGKESTCQFGSHKTLRFYP